MSYWEGKLGLLAVIIVLILAVIYLGLGVALIRQAYLLVKEKFTDKTRLINISLLMFVLTLTFLKPSGFIDFDKLEGENILIAEHKGSANCSTTLKLKENLKFTFRIVCFGITEIKGRYYLKNDTIYFLKEQNENFFTFAIIEKSKKNEEYANLKIYKNQRDTLGNKLWITKNDLNKLKNNTSKR